MRDPRLLYLSAAHREALASLVYGIEAELGFLALIAKPGMGETIGGIGQHRDRQLPVG